MSWDEPFNLFPSNESNESMQEKLNCFATSQIEIGMNVNEVKAFPELFEVCHDLKKRTNRQRHWAI